MNDLAARIAKLPPEQRRLILERLEGNRSGPAGAHVPRLSRDRESFPLSFAQERLWFLDQLTPGNPFYNLSFAQRVPFAVDPVSLDGALAELVRRHEALRTVFQVVRDEPVQRILPPKPVRSDVIDLAVLPPAQRESEALRLAAEAAQAPFDLTTGPLFRTKLIRLNPFESAFIFVIHHLVADSWSLEIIFRELATLYADAAAGRARSLAEPPVQYADFAVWQREWLQGEVLARQLDYWQNQLAGLSALNLPTDRPRPPVQTYRGASLEVTIPAAAVQAARLLARQAEATPFMVLLTTFCVLLHRYTGQEDVAVGVPIANRNRAEIENAVGFFANSLVLRSDLSGNPSFRSALARVRTTALEAYSHQDLPFAKLVAALRPGQDLSRNPLFQVSFQLVASAPGAAGGGRALPFERGTAIFDLVLNLWEAGAEVQGFFEFNTDLFDRATVERMAGHYLALLDAALKAPDMSVGALPYLTESERRQVLVSWNATAADYPADACLHTLFEQQAARTPRAAAVMAGTAVVTYADLNRSADRLTQCLRQCDVGGRQCVGVLLPESVDLVVAVLAILKAGAAYVPFETSTPRERLGAMIEDAAVEWVLTNSDLEPRLSQTGARAFLLDAEPGDRAGSEGNPVTATATDLAYVIFTSGSTGRPKGVMVSHRGVVNYLTWCLRAYPVSQGVGAPLCSPISSDMSVTSLFLPLLAGKALVLLEGENVVEALDAALRDGPGFSFVKLTPSHLKALGNLSIGRGAPRGTTAFIVGGEALHGDTLTLWREQAPEIIVFNEYGPTETVVGCCMHAVKAGDTVPGPLPIGRPIANTKLYVLDACGLPVPAGVPGELYIGGPGVARGYINQPALTAERFVASRFSEGPKDRLYRTGDRVRFRADGVLEFLGRCDGQIKIRGYRVEPGDVEAAIRRHPSVVDAAVLPRDFGDQDQRLVAYVIPSGPAGEARALGEELRRFLQHELPAYMVPSSFTPVDAIPLLKSGKVDRHALEALSTAGSHVTTKPVPPRTPLEDLLARIFRGVLKVASVGVHDDFFAHLGGHSLLATKAVARIREYLQVDLPLRNLFEAPTVEALAGLLLKDPATQPRVEQTAEAVLRLLDMSDEEVRAELTAGLPPGPGA